MLNAEKYREDIIKIILDKGSSTTVIKNEVISAYQKVISSCQDLSFNFNCNECSFKDNETCENAFILWMLEEYKEPIKLTEKEKAFVKMMIDNYGYLARDEDSYLYWYKNKPIKDKSFGCWVYPKEDKTDPRLNCFSLTSFIYPEFDFIKWEDEEPYSITELFERGVL